jgi:hypothetical protein
VSWWPRKCPVCRQELPERGNARRYVPWCRGFRLVHADACAAAIDAQGVLELDRRKAEVVDPVTLVRARAAIQRLLDRDQPVEHTLEHLIALACERVTLLAQKLVRDESADDLNRSPEQLRQLVDRVLAHRPEVSGPARTEATS